MNVKRGFTVSPLSGATLDFSTPIIYTLTSLDNTTQDYTVLTEFTPASSEKKINSFGIHPPVVTLNPAEGIIDEESKTITVTLPIGWNYDLTSLRPDFNVSKFALVSPQIAEAQDFSDSVKNPVIYTVTAQDGSSVEYRVTVK